MSLDEYAGLGLYDVCFQFAKLQSRLSNEGVSVKFDAENMALFVYESPNCMMMDYPVFEISFDYDVCDVAVLRLKTCGEFTIHPYLSWLWMNLSIELKAAMVKCLLEDSENGPKECF